MATSQPIEAFAEHGPLYDLADQAATLVAEFHDRTADMVHDGDVIPKRQADYDAARSDAQDAAWPLVLELAAHGARRAAEPVPSSKESTLLTDAPTEKPSTEGTIIPAGHTLGIRTEYASDDARDAASVLIAAGHTPALLSGRYEEDGSEDVDSAHGTGFMIDMRDSGRVLVYHLVHGGGSGAVSGHRDTLRAYRKALREAGWECDGRIFRCVHAWRTSPLPEGVTLAQTCGETGGKPAS